MKEETEEGQRKKKGKAKKKSEKKFIADGRDEMVKNGYSR